MSRKPVTGLGLVAGTYTGPSGPFSIVAGLIPTALGIGAGAGQRSAIAVTIIGGQSLCLLLTLLITPVAYSFFAELGEKRAFEPLQTRLARLRLGLARVFTMHVR